MSRDQAEVLHDYQARFEHDDSCENAQRLFRELNKHQMYLTVIRLYWKHQKNKASFDLGRPTPGF